MTIIRIVMGVYLFIHGFCHFVGFVVPWQIVTIEEEPYTTTLLCKTIDAGTVGIRVIGIIWLITGLLFIACAIALFIHSSWWYDIIFYLSIFSILLCVLGLPGAKIGILANIIILVFLFLGDKFELLPVTR